MPTDSTDSAESNIEPQSQENESREDNSCEDESSALQPPCVSGDQEPSE